MTWKVAQVFEMKEIPDYGQMFRKKTDAITLVKRHCDSEDEIIAVAVDADAVICAAPLQPLTRRVLKALPRCRMIQATSVGYEGVDVQAATELGIMVVNIPDYCLEEVSDHTMALILACTRKIVALNDAVRTGKWTSVAAPYVRQHIWPKLSRLKGQTLGLIGLGHTAQALVPKAKAFGLRVIAYSPHAPDSVFIANGVIRSSLDNLLMESDIVSVHAPLNSSTKGLLGTEQFKKMKPTAYLINTARGPLVKTQELYDCLVDGVIAGAALDVTDPEPIGLDAAILKLDNVIVTAHTAGASPTSMGIKYDRPVEEIVAVLVKKQWPFGLVNPQVKEAYQRKWNGQ